MESIIPAVKIPYLIIRSNSALAVYILPVCL